MEQRRRLPAQPVVVCEEGGVHLAQSRADARQGAVVRAALARAEVTVRARARLGLGLGLGLGLRLWLRSNPHPHPHPHPNPSAHREAVDEQEVGQVL